MSIHFSQEHDATANAAGNEFAGTIHMLQQLLSELDVCADEAIQAASAGLLERLDALKNGDDGQFKRSA